MKILQTVWLNSKDICEMIAENFGTDKSTINIELHISNDNKRGEPSIEAEVTMPEKYFSGSAVETIRQKFNYG